MKTLVTGATGFIGRRLLSLLAQHNHDIVVLTRSPERARESLAVPCEVIQWDPMSGPPPEAAFNGVSTVVHLAGEGVAEKRWSDEQKKVIRDSRIIGTRNLVEAIARRKGKPVNVIAASATGYYGERGDEILHETSPPGTGFLAEVCRDWEREAQALPYGSARLAIVRIGIVLGPDGGILKKLIPIFKTGTAGPIGSGKQWMSWIHIDDLVRMIVMAIENHAIEGAVNGVGPNPVSNADFSHALGKALHRPSSLKAPGGAIKVVMGEMADLALSSQRVLPEKALHAGFDFKFPTIEGALTDLVEGRRGSEELVLETWVPQSVEKVFRFFSDEKNLERLTPPWLKFSVIGKSTPEMGEGTLIDYKLKIKGFPLKWQSRIEKWIPNESFVDIQVKGPYSRWEHTHSFEAMKGGTLVRDRVRYSLPGGFLGKAIAGKSVKRDLAEIFRYRKEQVRQLLPAAS